MNLTVYDVIKRPLFTEKGHFIKERENKILFEVHPEANKIMIKKAVEELFKVKVEKVNIINTKGKIRRRGRYEGFRPGIKKAIVTLKPGEKLDFIEGA